MYNFFVDKNAVSNGICRIVGSDFNHVKNVLRLNVGEQILISYENTSSLCSILEFEGDAVIVKILEENYQDTSLPVDIYLFQGLPKSDKMELIVQKAVELGACGIIPVEMNRSIVKLDSKKQDGKISRWQAIAESAAKQCKRSFIPKIFSVISFKGAMQQAKELDLIIVPYENENGMTATKDVLSLIKPGMKIGVFIGPEGGFDPGEIELAINSNAKIVSLGKRILRTETAAIATVAMLMFHAEMNF